MAASRARFRRSGLDNEGGMVQYAVIDTIPVIRRLEIKREGLVRPHHLPRPNTLLQILTLGAV